MLSQHLVISYSWMRFHISARLFPPFSESWAESCPRYQLNAFFAMAHSTSFRQFKHSFGIGSPFGSFSKYPTIVHSEPPSLATSVDASVFVWFPPFSLGDIVIKKRRSNRRNNVIIKGMINGDSRNWNMLLSLWWTASMPNSEEAGLIALLKSTSLPQIRSLKQCILESWSFD